jgi:hypothetical protein
MDLFQQTNNFFQDISAWRKAYKAFRLTYLGVRDQGRLMVISAKVVMSASKFDSVRHEFKAGNIECREWDIDPNKYTVEQVIDGLTSIAGLEITGHGNLQIPVNDISYGVYKPVLLNQGRIKHGNRIGMLTITGSYSNNYLPQPETDWKLKAGVIPYDTLEELKAEFGLDTFQNDKAVLNVIALTAIEIAADSIVKGSEATIGVNAPFGLDNLNDIQIGFRVIEKNSAVIRGSVKWSNLMEVDSKDQYKRKAVIKVNPGAHVQCIASYKGIAHDVKTISDPSLSQNPRSTIISLVDPQASLLHSFLFPDKPFKGGITQNDFEGAISCLFWTLGFAPLNFGINSKTQNAFDTVLVTPNGHFVVIECTLATLRAESKLSKFAARTVDAREALAAAELTDIQVLPIMITALTREEVQVDIDQALNSNILVMTKEDIEAAHAKLSEYPNADAFYDELMNILQSSRNPLMFGNIPPFNLQL